MHGSIHLFVALPISMVQEGLRKRLILPGGQYPNHVLHSFAGPAPPLPFHAIAVEPVIRFCSTQVDFCMDAALAQAWDIGNNKTHSEKKRSGFEIRRSTQSPCDLDRLIDIISRIRNLSQASVL